MPNKLCFYHNADLDGKCSAAIVKMVKPDFELIPFDYNYTFPWNKIRYDTKVILVDISLDTKDMYKLNNICDLTYIDHHISILKDLNLEQFNGLQEDGIAACELTWKYFIDEKIPRGVKLLSDYDVWKINEDILNYQYGIRALDLDVNNTEDWNNNVFEDLFIPLRKKEGMAIRHYINSYNKDIITRNGYEEILHNYRCLTLNTVRGDSLLFQQHPNHKEYDIFMSIGFTGKIWKISLYTLKDDIDVSEICKKYGGGGHKKAAGFNLLDISILGKISGIQNNREQFQKD